jgi:hypothetical protein
MPALHHPPFLQDEKNLLQQIAQGDERAFATLKSQQKQGAGLEDERDRVRKD